MNSPIPTATPNVLPRIVKYWIFLFRLIHKFARLCHRENFFTSHLLYFIWKKIAVYSTPKQFNPSHGQPAISIDRSLGFTVTHQGTLKLPLQDKVTQEAHRLRSDVKDFSSFSSKSQSTYPYRLDLTGDMYANPPDSLFTQWALQQPLLDIIYDYLKVPPRLYSIVLSLSIPYDEEPSGVRNWHFDFVDYNMIQVITYLDDVDIHTGPFAVIDATASAPYRYRLKSEPYCSLEGNAFNQKIESHFPQGKIHPITGPTGTIIIADTARCLHRATVPTTKPRLALMVTYCAAVPHLDHHRIPPNSYK